MPVLRPAGIGPKRNRANRHGHGEQYKFPHIGPLPRRSAGAGMAGQKFGLHFGRAKTK
jgi:hypothetical protein